MTSSLEREQCFMNSGISNPVKKRLWCANRTSSSAMRWRAASSSAAAAAAGASAPSPAARGFRSPLLCAAAAPSSARSASSVALSALRASFLTRSCSSSCHSSSSCSCRNHRRTHTSEVGKVRIITEVAMRHRLLTTPVACRSPRLPNISEGMLAILHSWCSCSLHHEAHRKGPSMGSLHASTNGTPAPRDLISLTHTCVSDCAKPPGVPWRPAHPAPGEPPPCLHPAASSGPPTPARARRSDPVIMAFNPRQQTPSLR